MMKPKNQNMLSSLSLYTPIFKWYPHCIISDFPMGTEHQSSKVSFMNNLKNKKDQELVRRAKAVIRCDSHLPDWRCVESNQITIDVDTSSRCG